MVQQAQVAVPERSEREGYRIVYDWMTITKICIQHFMYD